jgi:hypothetical protein
MNGGPTDVAPRRAAKGLELDDQGDSGVSEQFIYEQTIERADPENFPINLPEPGKGDEVCRFTIPPDLRLSRWEVEVLESPPLAGYRVTSAPEPGAQGDQAIIISWWHPPYGKIRVHLRVYASPSGSAPVPRVIYDSPGWLDRSRDLIQQGLPIGFVVLGENAEKLHAAIEKIQREQSPEAFARPFFDPVITPTVVIVGLVVFAALALAGLFVLYSIVKEAMDKGYTIENTGYKFGVGEGPMRQEHELVFNLFPPPR